MKILDNIREKFCKEKVRKTMPEGKECAVCWVRLNIIDDFLCRYCDHHYCSKHRLPENHYCKGHPIQPY